MIQKILLNQNTGIFDRLQPLFLLFTQHIKLLLNCALQKCLTAPEVQAPFPGSVQGPLPIFHGL
jgi:hypothetical protein